MYLQNTSVIAMLLPKDVISIVYDYFYDIIPLTQKVLDQIAKTIYPVDEYEIPFQFSTYEKALDYAGCNSSAVRHDEIELKYK